MKLEFDFFSDELGVIPVNAVMEPQGGGYVMLECDATNHSGGELPARLMKQISEKAESLALDRLIDAAEAFKPEALH